MSERKFTDELTKDWYLVGKIALPLFVAAIVIFLIWGDWLVHSNIECFLFRVLHVYCPGCGGTRAFDCLVHGRILKSFLMNPFVPYSILVYFSFMVNTFLFKHTKKLGFKGFPITILTYVAVGILGGQCLIRNIIWLCFHVTVL